MEVGRLRIVRRPVTPTTTPTQSRLCFFVPPMLSPSEDLLLLSDSGCRSEDAEQALGGVWVDRDGVLPSRPFWKDNDALDRDGVDFAIP